MANRRYLVRGHVQGVSYRAAARQRARELGINGLARNLPDGRVEVLASADEAALAQLESFLWRGPTLARVDAIEVEEVAAQLPAGFTIG